MPTEIGTIRDWNRLLEETRTIVFLKHSASCGTSAQAFEDLEQAGNRGQFVLYYVVCQNSSALWENLKRQAVTGYIHNSPQVFIISGGKVVAQAHHSAITVKWVLEQLAKFK